MMRKRNYSEKQALAASQSFIERDYWLSKLAGDLEKSIFPYDYKTGTLKSGDLEKVKLSLDKEHSSLLLDLGKGVDHTLHVILVTAVMALLAKYTGRDDIIVGTSIYRQNIDTGLINTVLPLRNQVYTHSTFKELLLQVRQTIVDAVKNQNYPLEVLLEQLNISHVDEGFPLFDVVVLLDNIQDRKYIRDIFPNIMFSFRRNDGIVEAVLEYNPHLYHRTTIDRIGDHFIRLLETAISHPDVPLSQIDILSGQEKRQLLVDFNHTRREYPADKTIHELFDQQAGSTPDKTAVTYEDASLSYRELKERSSGLAFYLHSRGIKNQPIALMAENSYAVIVGLLGILKTGCAYLPINSRDPEERQNYLLEDSNVKVLLTNINNIKEGRYPVSLVVNLENTGIYKAREDFKCHRKGDNLAYIIYTSGSTGVPKGVMVKHRNVIRLVKNTNYVEFRERDSILLTGALEFDASTFEVWGTLLNGLKLYLTDKDTILTPGRLKAVIGKYDIRTVWMTSPLFNRMLDADIEIFAGLGNLLVGGDVLSTVHINRLKARFPHLKIINGYGPTENTTFSTTFLIDREYRENIPIGRPISNSTAYIVDGNNKLQPIGIAGELWVGGDGVARGYLNQPELTAGKFINSKQIYSYMSYGSYRSHIAKNKIYKTGDLARWLPDGNIEFIGRIDFQVKIRGFRIELEEIENQLLKHPQIKETVVTARENEKGEKYLAAYIVLSHEGEPGREPEAAVIPGLRHYLSQSLPGHMIPSYFIHLEKIPLTASGKIDRKALPEPEFRALDKYTAPANEIEEKLAITWSEILSIEKDIISTNANFFEIGGHSLRASALTAMIHRDLDVKVPLVEIFRNPSIQGLSRYIQQAAKEKYMSIEVTEEKEYYPLSSAQKRLYLLQQMDLAGTVYNVPQVVSLDVEVDKERLEEVFAQLVRRHGSFRTSFVTIHDEPVQRVHGNVEFEIEYYDLTTNKKKYKLQNTNKKKPNEEISDASDAIIQAETGGHHSFIRPFDLSKVPLLRVGLIKLVDKSHLLVVDMHHIISDGVSVKVLVEDFMGLYRGELLPGTRIQYKDYANWQNSEAIKKKLESQEDYWLKEFSHEIPVLDLPYDCQRPAVQGFVGSTAGFEISGEQAVELNALALEQGVTSFMMLFTIFNILLSKLSGQEEIVTGTPIAGRRHADLEKIIGMFVNTLALRNYPRGSQTFIELLQEIKDRTLKAFENQEYQFEDLVEKVDINRDVSRNPLFDVMFVLQDMDSAAPGKPGTRPGQYEYKSRTSKFDLTLFGVETGDHLSFTFEYSTKLFKQDTIKKFAGYFKQLVWSVLGDPGKKVTDLDILTTEEKRELLIDFNHSEVKHPVDKTIPQLFAAQAARSPDNIAAAGMSHSTPGMNYISYSQLDSRTNRLAHLLQAKGVKPGTIVGMMMNRSIEMIVGILGILKAHSAYLPINPKNPRTRTRYMLADCGAKILLSELIKTIDGIEVIDPGEVPTPSAPVHPMEEATLSKEGERGSRKTGGADLAYVIYTSGSTGNPKGVPITYSNFSPLVHWGYRDLGINTSDRAIQNLSYFFDWSVWEIFITLTTGAGLFMITEEILLNPDAQVDFIDKYGITVLHITPTQYQYLVNVGKKPGTLKYLFIGAEKLTYDLVKRSIESVGPYCRIFNMYGPTEATIISAVLEIQPEESEQYSALSSVPIGKPVGNTHLLVMDRYLNLCPVGVIGELYIAGDGVARGYLNRPELTAEKFQILNKTGYYRSYRSYQSYIIYKTGDLVRWLADGTVEFLGRVDHQVKVRGFRIELGEIENRLLNHEAIKDTIVIDKELKKGEKFICAYIVIKNSRALDQSDTAAISAELKKYLSAGLPDYMIPSYFIQLDHLPLNPNGKVDRKALPEPGLQPGEVGTAPRDHIEKKLAEIWAEVLGREVPGIDDDFFQLGGHSLKAAIITSKIHKELYVKIPLVEIFKRPNIRALSKYIAGAKQEEYVSVKPTEKKEYYVLSSSQKRLYILQQLDLESTGYNMPLFQPLSGDINKQELERSFRHLTRTHESLRTSFRMVTGEPVQQIRSAVNVKIEYYENDEGMEHCMWEKKLKELVKNFIKPFDLSRGPLLRVRLIRLDLEEQLMLIDMHHIITDGVSFNIIIKEFMTLYQGGNLTPRKLQYKDYAEWQQGDRHQKKIKQQESYWLKVFSGKLPVLHLPLDFDRPPKQSYAGKRLTFFLSEEETDRLKGIAAESNATLFMLFLSLVYVFFSRLTAREDIIIGTPAAGRPHADIENIVGMFVNTLALRSYPRGDKSFFQFLGEVKNQALEAFENQSYQFDDLVDKLGVKGAPNRNPLFDVMFVFNRNEENANNAIGANPSHLGKGDDWHKFNVEVAKFDLLLSVREERPLAFNFVYRAKLFKDQSMKKYTGYFRELISMVVDDCHRKISSMEIIPADEKKEIQNKIRQSEMAGDDRDSGPIPVILPRDPIEKKLAEICQGLLKRNNIGIHENFYQLGANSIKLLMMVSEVNKEFDRSLLITDIIEHLTIEKLALLLTGDNQQPQPDKNIVLLNSKNEKNKNIFLVHDVSGDINGYILFSKSLEDKYNVYGLIMDLGKNLSPVNTGIEKIASGYIEKIKHIQGAGPYDIGGWSAGGLIAFEIARQLEMSGEEISSLFMFDTPAPVKKTNTHPFSLPGEIRLIKKYFEIPASWENAPHITGMEELWQEFSNYLEHHERYNAAYVKNIFSDYVELIPAIDRLSPGKILRHINIIRSVSRACQDYYPGSKVKTNIQFYLPGFSEFEPTAWQEFCDDSILVYPTGGKHVTMLQEPHVSHLVDVFQKENQQHLS